MRTVQINDDHYVWSESILAMDQRRPESRVESMKLMGGSRPNTWGKNGGFYLGDRGVLVDTTLSDSDRSHYTDMVGEDQADRADCAWLLGISPEQLRDVLAAVPVDLEYFPDDLLIQVVGAAEKHSMETPLPTDYLVTMAKMAAVINDADHVSPRWVPRAILSAAHCSQRWNRPTVAAEVVTTVGLSWKRDSRSIPSVPWIQDISDKVCERAVMLIESGTMSEEESGYLMVLALMEVFLPKYQKKNVLRTVDEIFGKMPGIDPRSLIAALPPLGAQSTLEQRIQIAEMVYAGVPATVIKNAL